MGLDEHAREQRDLSTRVPDDSFSAPEVKSDHGLSAAGRTMHGGRGMRQHLIRSHHVVTAEGRVTTDLSIACTNLHRDVSLDACAVCSACRRMVILPENQQNSVTGMVICNESELQPSTVRPGQCAQCMDPHDASHGARGVEEVGAKVSKTVVAQPPGRILDEAPSRGSSMTSSQFGTEADCIAVSSIMTRQVLCVTPDLKIDTLMMLLVQRNVTGVPVVDRSGQLLGIVSKSDIVRMCHDDCQERTQKRLADSLASAAASRPFEATSELLDLQVAAAVGSEFNLPRHGVLCGAARDYLYYTQNISYLSVPMASAAGDVRAMDIVRVGDVMTPLKLTVLETASIAQAAALMAYEGVHRLPITSESGEVVGIVSASDILRWIAVRSRFGECMDSTR